MNELAPAPAIGRLQALWDDGLEVAYRAYLRAAQRLSLPARAQVAMAAALIERGLRLQRVGEGPPEAPALLLGDLCLSKASRLLVESGDARLQVRFARAVESLSAEAAAGAGAGDIRDRLGRLLGADS